MLKSVHNPKFAELTDAQLSAAYLAAEGERRQLIALYDSGADIDDSALEALSSQLFYIDDELCARDLPLPRE
jgi:hypothetical protein